MLPSALRHPIKNKNSNSSNKTRDAPIIGIGRLVHWYRPIVVYTIGKYKFVLHGVSVF